MIYLDNAATTFPKPQAVSAAVYRALMNNGSNPGRGGHKSTLEAGRTVFRAREEIGKMFSLNPEGVIFTLNCTAAINTAIYGIAERGDHFIISSLEHNSVLRPLERLREKGIADYSVAVVSPKNEEETVRSFSSLIKSNTKAIICTFASNVFGTVLPIRRLGELSRKRGLIFVVDAAQAAGCFKIDMEKTGIDILCAPGHKGLFGPMGTGVMLLSGRVVPDSLVQGGTGSFSMEKGQPEVLPDKFESGTLNYPCIAGLLEGVKFIKAYGGEREIHRKESLLINIIREDISVIRGIELAYEMQSEKTAPILSFNLKNFHSEQIGQALDSYGLAVRAGYHCAYLPHNIHNTAERGTVRVSPGVFTSKKDVKNFVFSLNKIAMGKNMCYN